MSTEQPFQCEVPGCTNRCSRVPHVCTKHFIEGWGRLPDMPLPEVKPEVYVSDKDRKASGKK